MVMKYNIGTKEKPMVLKTPPLSSGFAMHAEEKDGKQLLVCTVGKTVLQYDYRCLDDLHVMYSHFIFLHKLHLWAAILFGYT